MSSLTAASVPATQLDIGPRCALEDRNAEATANLPAGAVGANLGTAVWVIMTVLGFDGATINNVMQSTSLAQYSVAMQNGTFRHECILAYGLAFLILVGKPPGTASYFAIYMSRRARNLLEVAGAQDGDPVTGTQFLAPEFSAAKSAYFFFDVFNDVGRLPSTL